MRAIAVAAAQGHTDEGREAACLSLEPSQPVGAWAGALGATIAVLLAQMALRTMLLLRRWNY
ncbi:MAG TPA: hypothetical protein VEJ67_16775 [Candidatus Cybelea sp.]|nr:hypothetical protein [Candidatus Cybelea sp.]